MNDLIMGFEQRGLRYVQPISGFHGGKAGQASASCAERVACTGGPVARRHGRATRACLGPLGWRCRRNTLFEHRADHACECEQPGSGLGVSHRRSRKRPPAAMARTKFEATPLLVENSLVFCTPFNEVIALDPGTGAQKCVTTRKSRTANARPTATIAAASPIGWTVVGAGRPSLCIRSPGPSHMCQTMTFAGADSTGVLSSAGERNFVTPRRSARWVFR